ncbi:hypothetical protein HY485_02595 [Candidatus Woesearchaeota archaeon]|nr:hypothetical protein [Candidatus Woesearchaeota archaeon]
MIVQIEKNHDYGESNVTFIGITKSAYGRAQYILVNSDDGENECLKFPGLRFRGNLSSKQTLDDVAQERFEEQTGLEVSKMLGLRAVVPTRSRHRGQWIFRNIFLGVVDDVRYKKGPDKRRVYLADPSQGCFPRDEYVLPLGASHKKTALSWVTPDNQIVARIATDMLYDFDWHTLDTNYYRRIPCVGAEPLALSFERPLGCGLAVSSIILLYQPSFDVPKKVILLKRKGDVYPGFAGGKIEVLKSPDCENVDPVSCCAKEGREEFGFDIQPRALNAVALTRLQVPSDVVNAEERFYNSIVTYSFIAEPTNPQAVERALENPKDFLEGKMENYVVETLDELRDRVYHGKLRMPDMISTGEQFFRTSPGEKISLTQIVSSGAL